MKTQLIKSIINAALFAFAPAWVLAVDYTGPQIVGSENLVLNPGDTIVVDSQNSEAYVLRSDGSGFSASSALILNGGAGNPVELRYGSEENRLAKSVVMLDIYGNGRMTMNDSNVSIKAYGASDTQLTGVRFMNTSSSANFGTGRFDIYIDGGSNSTGIYLEAGAATIGGTIAMTQGVGINATSSSKGDFVFEQLAIKAVRADLVTHAVRHDSAYFIGVWDANIDVTGNAIIGSGMGDTFMSGVIHSGDSAIKLIGPNVTNGSHKSVSFGNAVVSSGNGILLEAGKNTSLSFSDDSVAIGRILKDNGVSANLILGQNSVWKSTGSSDLDVLTIGKSRVEYELGSLDDKMTIASVLAQKSIPENEFIVTLSDEFLASVEDGFILNIDDHIIVTEGSVRENPYLNFSVSTSNSNGSTWDLENLGDGSYAIKNINIVPEPAAYAALFALFSLAFASRRGRTLRK